MHSITNLALVDLLSVTPRSAQRSKNSFADRDNIWYLKNVVGRFITLLLKKVFSIGCMKSRIYDWWFSVRSSDKYWWYSSIQQHTTPVWPILGRFINTDQKEPFIIGIFSGTSKPNDLDEYFREFRGGYNELHLNGLSLGGKTVYWHTLCNWWRSSSSFHTMCETIFWLP